MESNNCLRSFETINAYNAEKDSLEYPTISYVKEKNRAYFAPKPSLYEWVDLGLPSGLLWSAWNVGATKPEEFGLYFAWGETQGYTGITDEKQFSWADYTLCDGTESNMLKYNATDGLTTLELVDDAAHVTDNTCRMPTSGECQELISNTTSAWTEVNGVYGCQFTSNVNENSIFIPAAGYCVNGSFYYVGQYGTLWSSSLSESDTRYVFDLYFYPNTMSMNGDGRHYGFSVRPVKVI